MPDILRTAMAALMIALPLLSGCSTQSDPGADPDNPPRQVSVRVYYTDSTTPNVLVNVPLRAVTTAIRLATIAHAFGADIEVGADDDRTVRLDKVDLEAVRKALLAMEPGPVLQVEEGGERVEIWID